VNVLKRLNKKIKDICAKPHRKRICAIMRNRLINKDVSIISSNCIGGILSHDLNIQFNSPTVNLFFSAEDFIKFATNLERYVGLTPVLDAKESKEKGYVVAALDDIHLYGVHYHDIEELQNSWKRRSERINWNNLFFIMTDRNGMNEGDLVAFSKLPYPKVLFSSKQYPQYDFVVYINDFKNESQVGQLHFYADYKGNRYYEKYFDMVGWLNNETL